MVAALLRLLLVSLSERMALRRRRRIAFLSCGWALAWVLMGAAPAFATGPASYFTKLTGSGQSLTEARVDAVAATLPSGQVLIAGGESRDGSTTSAELFNPATDTFTKLTGAGQSLAEGRRGAVAARLRSGQILIAGGYNGTAGHVGRELSSTELFNPATDTFTELTGNGFLSEVREEAVAATLPSGQVLIAGGDNQAGSLSSAELFNPATDTFSKLTGTGQSLTEARVGAVASTLPSGQVLIAGGGNMNGSRQARNYLTRRRTLSQNSRAPASR